MTARIGSLVYYSQIISVVVVCVVVVVVEAHIASAGYSKDSSIANLKTTVGRKKTKKTASSLLIGGIYDKNHMIFYVSIYLHRMPILFPISR